MVEYAKEELKKSSREYNIERVRETGPSLRSVLCNAKPVSLGPKYGPSTRCKRNCVTCPLMSPGNCNIKLNCKNIFKTAPGNCLTKNCIYLFQCKLCKKQYVGKTTQTFSSRVSGHKTCMKQYFEARHMIDVPETNEVSSTSGNVNSRAENFKKELREGPD